MAKNSASASSKDRGKKKKTAAKDSKKNSGKKSSKKVLTNKKLSKANGKKTNGKKLTTPKKVTKKGATKAAKKTKKSAPKQQKKKNKKTEKKKKKIKNNHCIVYDVKPKAAILQTDATCDEQVLQQFVHPLCVDQFMDRHWRKKTAAAFCGGGPFRSLPFKKLMDNLDLKEILEKSPSEGIQCWMKPQEKHIRKGSEHCKPLESITTPCRETALKLHEVYGAAMYFRAPDEVSEAVLNSLTNSLGMNFSAYFPDGQTMSETETFVAKKGHVTGWHTDFQNNFTIQLKGKRKWTLRHPDGDSLNSVKSWKICPVRGLAPHYATLETYETQMKSARAVDGLPDSELCDFLPPKEFFKDSQEVILEPGDVLFHPAGVWHQVEALDDCLAINFSLHNLTYADVIGDAVKHLLHSAGSTFTERISNFRPLEDENRIVFEDFSDFCQNVLSKVGQKEMPDPKTLRTLYISKQHDEMVAKFEHKIEEMKSLLDEAFSASFFLPIGIATPRKLHIKISEGMVPVLPICALDDCRRNWMFASIVPLLPELEEHDSDSESENNEYDYKQVAVHVNFHGNENKESALRTVISYPAELQDFLDRLCVGHSHLGKTKRSRVASTKKMEDHLVCALVYSGFLVQESEHVGAVSQWREYCEEKGIENDYFPDGESDASLLSDFDYNSDIGNNSLSDGDGSADDDGSDFKMSSDDDGYDGED